MSTLKGLLSRKLPNKLIEANETTFTKKIRLSKRTLLTINKSNVSLNFVSQSPVTYMLESSMHIIGIRGNFDIWTLIKLFKILYHDGIVANHPHPKSPKIVGNLKVLKVS